ncbi:MAG TPA: glycosyltransferase family 87 protein [Candidatus Angelobacter sp.]
MEAAGSRLHDKLPASRNLRIILWTLIFLASAEFIVRGPVRFLNGPSNWNDLSQNYTASKLWLKGQSPSDPRNFVALWKYESGSRLELTDIRTHLAPPLGGLVVLAPVAVFPWKIAKILWLAVLLTAFVATVWALVRASSFPWNDTRTLAFIAACLALAPFQTGIGSGNPSILVIGLCPVAIWAAQRRSDIAAGILFGMACSMKPQLGAFLVLYYLVRRRWQLFMTAVASTAALNLVAVLYLQLRGTSWIQDYLRNAKGFIAANPIDDFSTLNPSRFTLINLQVPFFSITGHSSSANLLAMVVGGVLLCAWVYWVWQSPADRAEILPLATVSVLSLLPVYHRFYDAALLVLPLCWCVAIAVAQPRTIAKIALLLMTPFLVPGTAFLQQVAAHGKVPDSFTQSWLWNCIVMPHETWALLLLGLVLLYGMKSEATGQSEEYAVPT